MTSALTYLVLLITWETVEVDTPPGGGHIHNGSHLARDFPPYPCAFRQSSFQAIAQRLSSEQMIQYTTKMQANS